MVKMITGARIVSIIDETDEVVTPTARLITGEDIAYYGCLSLVLGQWGMSVQMSDCLLEHALEVDASDDGKVANALRRRHNQERRVEPTAYFAGVDVDVTLRKAQAHYRQAQAQGCDVTYVSLARALEVCDFKTWDQLIDWMRHSPRNVLGVSLLANVDVMQTAKAPLPPPSTGTLLALKPVRC